MFIDVFSISTNLICALSQRKGILVAAHVNTGDITSSPGHKLANLYAKCKACVPAPTATQEQKDHVIGQAKKLHQMIEDAPKSRGWNRRAKVGSKKRWYKIVHSMDGTRNAD